MNAIVYTSNTGTTKEYAKLLSDKLSLPYYSLDEIEYKVKPGSKIIYLGWIMASRVKGYKKVVKDYVAEKECKNGLALWPLRTAVSGKQMTPGGAYEIMDILGKEESLKRIRKGIELLNGVQ